MAITVPTDAYLELADLAYLLPRRTLTAAPLSTAIVEEHIKSIANEINGVLEGRGYAIPVTTDVGKRRLKTLNGYGAAHLVELALQGPNVGGPDAGGTAAMFGKLYRDGLKLLKDDAYSLGGVSPASSTPAAGNADLASGGSDEDPAFTRGMEF